MLNAKEKEKGQAEQRVPATVLFPSVAAISNLFDRKRKEEKVVCRPASTADQPKIILTAPHPVTIVWTVRQLSKTESQNVPTGYPERHSGEKRAG
ncbi:hypothetical protein [Desulfurivibrio dismutans]|uniref:hypothetical protein n=1 Tax=Desulfurivibrio dismutans TaxID=1398908 RepID=UPI0023DCB267|nr:hypothetical protein [Desulfurivibrio alkaliphilus]MDF1614636.1 hypothetical protein [Desulfurivibrio alkaliphilus]